MQVRAAKELLHIEGWLERSAEIVARGKEAYLVDALLQEAGDSLMMKLVEAANRLSKMEVSGVLRRRCLLTLNPSTMSRRREVYSSR